MNTVILYGDSISPRLVSPSRKRFLHVRELPGATLFQLSREYQQANQWPTLIPYERGSQVEFYVLDKASNLCPWVSRANYLSLSATANGAMQGAQI